MIQFLKKYWSIFVAFISIITIMIMTVIMAFFGRKYNGIDQDYINDQKKKIDDIEKKKKQYQSEIDQIKKEREAKNEKIDNMSYDDFNLNNDPIVKRNRTPKQ